MKIWWFMFPDTTLQATPNWSNITGTMCLKMSKIVEPIVSLENAFLNNLSSINIKNLSNHGGIYRLDRKFNKTCEEA